MIESMRKNESEHSKSSFWLIAALFTAMEKETVKYPEWTDVLI